MGWGISLSSSSGSRNVACEDGKPAWKEWMVVMVFCRLEQCSDKRDNILLDSTSYLASSNSIISALTLSNSSSPSLHTVFLS